MLTAAIRKITGHVKADSPAMGFLQEAAAKGEADRQTSLKAYRELILSLSQDEAPGIPPGELHKLLSHLGFSDKKLAEDVSRTRQFKEHAAAQASLPEIEAAKETAAAELEKWQAETQKLVDAREAKRTELAITYRESEVALSALREQVRQAPMPEDLSPEFGKWLGKIASRLQQSVNPVNQMYHAGRDAERDLERMRADVKNAATPSDKKQAELALKQNERRLQTIIDTSQSFERRRNQLLEIQERAKTELHCPETGLARHDVDADEFFRDVDLSEFALPREGF